jgi:hypothetical protein
VSDTLEVEYIEERGPGIPELPSDVQLGGAPAPEPVAPVYPGWEEQTVEQFLLGFGAGVHMLIGQAESDWLMTRKDLERIAPPMTRIANRWEPALRLSPYADPLLVAHGMALYGWRSALERARALRDRQEQAEASPRARYERAPEGSPEEPGEQPVDEDTETYFPTRGEPSE